MAARPPGGPTGSPFQWIGRNLLVTAPRVAAFMLEEWQRDDPKQVPEIRSCIGAAIAWLLRAQEASGDGGVSIGYSVLPRHW